MDVYEAISFCFYFIMQFFFTQKIYTYNYFILAFFVSLIIPVVSFFEVSDKNYWLKNMPVTFITFIFLILLIIIKIVYKRFNQFLIDKNVVKNEFRGKDFTYVLWEADVVGIENWWDEKLAVKPSWFDHFITLFLIITPLFLVVALGKLF
jgi:hypothetical protein